MNEDLHNDLDKFFRDSIEPLRKLPGKHVWESIEKQLDKKKDKRKYMLFKTTGVVLLLLLLCFATFNVTNNKMKNGAINVSTATKTSKLSDRLNITDSSLNKYNKGMKQQNSSGNDAFLDNQKERDSH